jgi:FixH
MNWGNKLLLTFIVFGTGMGYLVYRAIGTEFELVEKDYYKKELRYQQVIDGTERANTLSTAIDLKQTEKEISLEFPKEMIGSDIKGTAWFYCAYDSKKDRKLSLELNSEGIQLLEKDKFSTGTYIVKIDWTASDKNYYTEKTLTIR